MGIEPKRVLDLVRIESSPSFPMSSKLGVSVAELVFDLIFLLSFHYFLSLDLECDKEEQPTSLENKQEPAWYVLFCFCLVS